MSNSEQEILNMLRERTESLQSENVELRRKYFESEAERKKALTTVKEKDEQIRKLYELAMINPVSGLHNLNFINTEITRITAAKKREEERIVKSGKGVHVFEFVGMVFIDIDNFKYINDTYGHSAGDMVLRHLGQTITSIVRKVDIAAHPSGDEFYILSLFNNRKEGRLFHERISESLKNLSLEIEKSTISYSVSVGYVRSVIKKDFSFQNLKDRADLKMYSAKKREDK